jgi:hypothetical protein
MGETTKKTISNVYNKFYIDSSATDFFKRGKMLAASASTIGSAYSLAEGEAGSPAYEGAKDSRPVGITRQVDTEKFLYTKPFFTYPRELTYMQKKLAAYDTKGYLREEEVAKIREQVNNYMAYHYTPTLSGRIIASTGSARTTILASNGVATGNRKAFVENDIIDGLSKLSDYTRVMGGETICVINDAILRDLLRIEMFFKYDATGVSALRAKTLEQGFIQVGGATWVIASNFKKCTGVRFNTDGVTPKSDNIHALASTDKGAILMFNTKAVGWAIDQLDISMKENEPTFEQSDITEIATMAIGGKLRTDEEGVCAIVEG